MVYFSNRLAKFKLGRDRETLRQNKLNIYKSCILYTALALILHCIPYQILYLPPNSPSDCSCPLPADPRPPSPDRP